MTLGEIARSFDLADRIEKRRLRRDARGAWLAQSLKRRRTLPTLERYMRELFPDLSRSRLAQAKVEFAALLETMGSPPKSPTKRRPRRRS